MRILITGHTGFVGTWLGTYLSRLGHELYGYSLPPRATSLFASDTRFPGVFKENYFGKIQQREEFVEFAQKVQPEIIFHLAAQALVRQGYRDPIETFSTNAMGTANLLESLRFIDSVKAVVMVTLSVMECADRVNSIKSVILITTDKVYKQNSERISFTEEAELVSKEPYGASKVAAEQVIQAYYSNLDKPKFSYAIARAGYIVGAGDDGEARLIPYLMMCASTSTTVILRQPTATRPWTYILDIINGYWKLVNHINGKKGYLGAWNFGTNPSGRLTVLETTNLIMQELGIPKPNIKNSPETFYEQEFLELSSLKSFRELNWRPKFTAEQAVKTAAKNHFRFIEIGNFNAVTKCLDEYEIPEEQNDFHAW